MLDANPPQSPAVENFLQPEIQPPQSTAWIPEASKRGKRLAFATSANIVDFQSLTNLELSDHIFHISNHEPTLTQGDTSPLFSEPSFRSR